MKKSILLTSFILTLLALQAQNGNLFILNEGVFGSSQGSIGYIEYPANTYHHIDSIAGFGNQIVHNPFGLFAVDGNGDVRVYDATTYQQQTTLNAQARSILVNLGYMATCGNIAPYVRVYNLADYSVVFDTDTLLSSGREEMVLAAGSKIFISSYYGDSNVWVVDLLAQTADTVKCSTDNPNQLEVLNGNVFVGNYIYDLATFTTHTMIDEIDPITLDIVSSFYVPNADGFTADENYIYLKSSAGDILRYNPQNGLDTLPINGNFYMLDARNSEDVLFYSQTDYVSYGNVGKIDLNTNSLSSGIPTHVSPRACSFTATPVSKEQATNLNHFSLYPNPATDKIYLKGIEKGTEIKLWDAKGLFVKSFLADEIDPILNIHDLAAGLYLCEAQGYSLKFIKQ